MAAEMVGSALAQEGVSGVCSYVSAKLEETASRAHNMARLEMALSQLEFALERAGKLPITYASLLRRMKVLRSVYADGTALLNKLRVEQAAAPPPRHPLLDWIGRAKNSPVSSILGLNKDHHLSSSAVPMFEWYAACADRFVADVESGCPVLRRDAFRYPLVRQLLEGKTLWRHQETVRGRQLHSFFLWPVHLEERGVEARLVYEYLDREKPERCFRLRLMLRLSEGADVVGIAIKCLQSVSSQFKLVTESAVGELALLHHQQDISHSYGPPLDWTEETYAAQTRSWRPDPICCTNNHNNTVVSSHGVPEQVIAVGYGCYISASADQYALALPPDLYLVAAFVPHHTHGRGAAAPRGIVLSYGGEEECVGGSIQQVEQVVRSKAIDRVVRQPVPADYDVCCYAPHGFARITLRKASGELAAWTRPTAAPRRGGRSSAKRKR